MSLSLEFLLALRFLRSKRKEGFISVVSGFSLVGIALGVATLIVVMSVMNGYHKEFVRNVLGIQGHISIVSKENKFKNYTESSNKIEKLPDVLYSAPMIIEQAMLISGDNAQGGVVRGVDPDKLAFKPMVMDSISSTTLKQLKNSGGVVMGDALARSLGVKIGDEIKIVIASGTTTVLGTVPRSKTFKVIDTFDLGLYQYNSTTLFMNLKDAQKLFKYNESVSEIEVISQNPDRLDDLKAEIGSLFGSDVYMVDWKMSQAKWLNALEVERVVMFFILTLIILVAVFNIISSLIMLVKDKSKSIAILRTMGMTKSSIIRIFIMAGSLIGIIGSCTGVLLGILVATNLQSIKSFLEDLTGTNLFDPVIYFLTKLPSEIIYSDVLFIFIMALGFALLATIYPAYRASKLLPIEVLRYE